MIKNNTIFIGLDLGDKYSHLTIIDQEGNLVEETRLPTTKKSFHRRFSDLPGCRIALEVGAHSRWVSHLLSELGHDALVANARKLRAIYHNPRKGDRADAETLARLARLDPKLLSPIYHRSPEAQADLAVIRSRDALVRSRTLMVNHLALACPPAALAPFTPKSLMLYLTTFIPPCCRCWTLSPSFPAKFWLLTSSLNTSVKKAIQRLNVCSR